jgi:hypothetical protein
MMFVSKYAIFSFKKVAREGINTKNFARMIWFVFGGFATKII